MAKGKGKGSKPSSSPSLQKRHGPKKKMFHKWTSTMRLHLAGAGLLTKFNNRESFDQAVMSRGIKNVPTSMWEEMRSLKTMKEKKAWFKAIKTV